MTHKQVICTTSAGEKIEVDEKIAPFVQRLWDNGVKTWVSCQWDGSENKKFPAYINPRYYREISAEADYTPYATPIEMATILGLKRNQWRQYNGVLWLHRDLLER